MKDILLVGLGGFVGSAVRYSVYLLVDKVELGKPHVGTLLVNLIGCFLIGVLSGEFFKLNNPINLLLIAGFCGGFTTFSTFALDGLKLMKDGLILQFILYAAANMIGGLLVCMAGFYLVNKG